MPPQRKPLDPCGVEGHKIESIVKGMTVLPGKPGVMAQSLVEDRTIICTRCGRSFDEIRRQAAVLVKNDETP